MTCKLSFFKSRHLRKFDLVYQLLQKAYCFLVGTKPTGCLNIMRVYSRARPCGISTIWKKMPHKICVCASNGAPKNRPKDKYYFFLNKEFKSITDNNTDLTAAL